MADIQTYPEMKYQLTPAMINVLIALSEGEKHSFAITVEIEAFTNGGMKIGPGTLFSSLKRLLKAGLVEQSDERIDPELDDQIRRYYCIKGLGQRALRLEQERRPSHSIVTQTKDLLGNSFMGGA